MPAESLPNRLDSEVLKLLACPACQGTLSLIETGLVCASCAHAYPIIGGIPVLIPNRAEK